MLRTSELGRRPSELPAWVVVSAAGLGGLMYWVAIFPVDQVKSAMQTDAIDPAQRRFPNMAVATQARSTALLLRAIIYSGAQRVGSLAQCCVVGGLQG